MKDLENSVVNSTFDEWLSSQTGTIDIDCGCVSTEAFYYWLRKAYEARASAAPDGWKLVPVIPTDKMLLNAMIAGEVDSILPAISRAESMWEQFLAAAPNPE